jgi:hypothetical protein
MLCNLVLRITAIFDFVHRRVFQKLENTTFRKLYLLPSAGEGKTPTPLGSLKRTNLGHWKMDKVQKPTNSEYYTLP